MKRILHYASIFAMAALTAILMMPLTTTAQSKLSDNVLRERGKQYYDRLPATVGLEHAPTFADAVRYLFAYEQRRYRKDNSPGSDLMEAMNWLYESLDGFKMGKGDAIGRHRDDDQLLEKGLSKTQEAKNSVDGGRIWNIEAYISAYANLYAYLQVVSPSSIKKTKEFINARNNEFAWLREYRDRLADAGGKGDRMGDLESWLPSNPKPGTKPVVEPGFATLQYSTIYSEPIKTEQEMADEKSEARQKLKERLKKHVSKQELEYSSLKTRYKKLRAELLSVRSRLKELKAQGVGDGSLKARENNGYDVILIDIKGNKIPVIKAVRSITGLGLKESKELVDRLHPTFITKGVPKEKAKNIENMLEKAGAKIVIKESRIR